MGSAENAKQAAERGTSTTRIVVVTGKGGVGKTTVAAATALRSTECGHRTIVTSTDPAHSLADACGVRLGSEPTEIAPNCWAQELDARERMEDAWSDIQSYVRQLFQWAGADGIEAEELSLVPGIDEILALIELRHLCESGDWDVVVVDCAPTAETLRLLSLPEVLSWYMERAFPMSRRVVKAIGPVVRRLSSVPVANDRVFEASERLYEELSAVRALLGDSERTSVRLVATPEHMVIAEAKRTYAYLALFGYHVDAVIMNRVWPADIDHAWVTTWRSAQDRQLEIAREAFDGTPMRTLAMADSEVLGIDALGAVGVELFGEDDPSASMQRGPVVELVGEPDCWRLVFHLGHAERGEVEAATIGSELFVRCGPYRRSLALPDSLRRETVTAAQLVDGDLEIVFSRHNRDGSQPTL